MKRREEKTVDIFKKKGVAKSSILYQIRKTRGKQGKKESKRQRLASSLKSYNQTGRRTKDREEERDGRNEIIIQQTEIDKRHIDR